MGSLLQTLKYMICVMKHVLLSACVSYLGCLSNESVVTTQQVATTLLEPRVARVENSE